MINDTSARTMRAAVWLGANDIALRDTDIPDTAPGWTKVKVEYAGICGTDLAIFIGKHPRATNPLIIGHEVVGIVDQGAVDGPTAGTRVAIEPLISCQSCRACRDGVPHVCRELKLFGIDAPGGLAEYINVPTDRLIPVAPEVPALRAAWAEPLAVAVHSVGRAEMTGDETILIFGAGPIGILVALVARHSGAGRIVIVEPNPNRRRVAVDLGFDMVPVDSDPVTWFRSSNGGEGADVVFDTAGHPSVASILPAAARTTGTVVVVAVYKDVPSFDLRAVCFGEQHVVGARVYTREHFQQAVDLMTGDPLGLDSLPTAQFALDSVREAFALATSEETPMKIFLRPGDVDEALIGT